MSTPPEILGFTFQTPVNSPANICYLTREFILEKTPPIFQMLIGVGGHQMTTSTPSRDKNGNYTILQDLNITRTPFLALMSFLRLGFLAPAQLSSAMDTANILGGIPELDAYLCQQEEAHRLVLEQHKAAKSLPLPKCPEDDTHGDFNWVTVTTDSYPMAENTRLDYVKHGWSATGQTVVIKDKTLMWYRGVRPPTARLG